MNPPSHLTPNSHILDSKKKIMVYCGNISEYVFKKYIKKGLPARYEDGRWLAYTDNIDDWFKAFTRISMAQFIDQIPAADQDASDAQL